MNKQDKDFGLQVLKTMGETIINRFVDLNEGINFTAMFDYIDMCPDDKETVEDFLNSLPYLSDEDKQELWQILIEAELLYYDRWRDGKINEVEYRHMLDSLNKKAELILGFNFEIANREGGGEGGAEDVEIVYLEKTTNRYYRITGYYYSYDGFNMSPNTTVEVEPYEKTITAYRNVGSK